MHIRVLGTFFLPKNRIRVNEYIYSRLQQVCRKADQVNIKATPGTMSGGQFDWGGRLPKSNGGARRSPQPDWKPGAECNGIRGLDCESDETSRYESRS